MNQHRPIAVEYADTRARFSAREFARMIDAGAFDDMKVELIRGELERMPPPETRHANWQSRILIRLARLIDESRLFGEVGVELDEETIVGCDIAVVDAVVTDNRRLRPADIGLVVEIAVSSIGRDLGLKRALYAAAGIGCYWVIDPERGVTHVYREPVAGDYRAVATIPFGETLAVPGTDTAIVLA